MTDDDIRTRDLPDGAIVLEYYVRSCTRRTIAELWGDEIRIVEQDLFGSGWDDDPETGVCIPASAIPKLQELVDASE